MSVRNNVLYFSACNTLSTMPTPKKTPTPRPSPCPIHPEGQTPRDEKPAAPKPSAPKVTVLWKELMAFGGDIMYEPKESE